MRSTKRTKNDDQQIKTELDNVFIEIRLLSIYLQFRKKFIQLSNKFHSKKKISTFLLYETTNEKERYAEKLPTQK